MTGQERAEDSADGWSARFIEIAKRMSMATPDPSRPKASEASLPEARKRALEELGTLLPTFCEFLTQQQIDELLTDEDPDVRLAAATTLPAENEELRQAVLISAFRCESVAGVLASRRRAREPSASTPPPNEPKPDERLWRWLDACERNALASRYLNWGTNAADLETVNKRMHEIVVASEALQALSLSHLALPYMDCAHARTRLSAALVCFDLDAAKAIATIESVAQSGNLSESDDAKLILFELGLHEF